MQKNLLTTRTTTIALFLLCILGHGNLYNVHGADKSLGEPGRSSGQKNPLKNVYFGEQHLHTRNSFDAFTVGVNATWDDAYNFAKTTKIANRPVKFQFGVEYSVVSQDAFGPRWLLKLNVIPVIQSLIPESLFGGG